MDTQAPKHQIESGLYLHHGRRYACRDSKLW